MKIQHILYGVMASYCLNSVTHADFIEDASGTVYLKNFYFNRNFDDKNTKTLSNWSQAASVLWKSGYTDTPLQFGLDTNIRYAYRLSSAKNIVDSVMPYDVAKQQQAQDQVKLGAVLRMKYSKTELQIGELSPRLPIVHTDVAMQLPTTFLGGMLESNELKNTKITLGRLTKVSGRNSEDYSKFQLVNGTTKAQSDALNFAGIDYDFKQQQVRYFIADLEDIYLQNFLSYEHRFKLNDQLNLKSNFYLFDTQDTGDALEGKIDSQAYATLQTLSYGNHAVAVGYKHMAGDTKFPLLANWVPQLYLANWSVGTFMQKDERSWQLRYDYDFKGLGLEGLKTTLRYYDGGHIDNNGGKRGTEKEFDFIVNYDVQSGPLKGMGMSWLYADYKNSLAKDYTENRLALTYTYKF
ncbi:OprD family outer membrane porin [Acinetobacter gerneri]|uniref:OprD family outer membrane porin n=1 Tax=Acinetobacter gerneri TaxID=202952 RepID=UPI002935D982|nr:OprD family outer membrane porin [Acinetobacter gerneri]MDV2438942.1 OprD family outer membrane porin [Acinetobacter gerneri]